MNRRKFISISASSAALAFLPSNSYASNNLYTWSGKSLGANSSLKLYSNDKNFAQKTIDEVLKKIYKLENIFSLYKKNSSINRLNNDGYLDNPPKELVELIRFSQKISKQSNGYFDISVQPLWDLYSKHHDNTKLIKKQLPQLLELVDYKKIKVSDEVIRFDNKHMKITLNGVAQGFISDKIASFLKEKGFENVLVDLGEISAIGRHPQNRTWKIKTPYLSEEYISIEDESLASSGAYGTRFNDKYHHLFDAKNKTSANYVEAVSVKAKNATLADALSTAFAVMPKKLRIKLEEKYKEEIEVYYM